MQDGIAPAAESAPVQAPDAKPDAAAEGLAVRYKQQLDGQRPLVEEAVRAGFKTPEDIKEVGELVALARASGMTVAALREALRQEPVSRAAPVAEPPKRPDGAIDTASIESMVESRLEGRFAERDHQSAAEREQELLHRAAVEIAGPDADADAVDLVSAALKAKARANRDKYPPNHPLAERYYRPLNADKVDELAKRVREQFGKVVGAKSQPAPKPVAVTGGPSGLAGVPAEVTDQKAKIDEIFNRFKNRRG